jgi:hypothetical protein
MIELIAKFDRDQEIVLEDTFKKDENGIYVIEYHSNDI